MKKTIILISTLIIMFSLSLTACKKTTDNNLIDFCQIVTEITNTTVTTYDKAPKYFTIGKDNSFCRIETHPAGVSLLEGYSASNPAFDYIKIMNRKLGLPDYLYQLIMKVTERDGIQTRTFDEITVSYILNYDTGLKVTYYYNK